MEEWSNKNIIPNEAVMFLLQSFLFFPTKKSLVAVQQFKKYGENKSFPKDGLNSATFNLKTAIQTFNVMFKVKMICTLQSSS